MVFMVSKLGGEWGASFLGCSFHFGPASYFEEHAQDGRGVRLAARSFAGSPLWSATSIRAFCAWIPISQCISSADKEIKSCSARHLSRFREDFTFQLTEEEMGALRLQIEAQSRNGRTTLSPAQPQGLHLQGRQQHLD
jgi:hypothetical protein